MCGAARSSYMEILKIVTTMKRLYAMAAAVCVLAACSPVEPDDGNDDISLTAGSSAMTVWADETTVNDGRGLSFTTTGAWHAEADASAGWLSFAPESGDAAGDYTMDITLAVNETGVDRSAVIRIVCGGSVLAVTVTQKGSVRKDDGSGDGEVVPPAAARAVAGIVREAYLWSEVPEDYVWKPRSEWTFRYDEQGRVAEYTAGVYSWDGSESDVLTVTLDYRIAGEVRIGERDGYGDDREYTVVLADNGYAGSVEVPDDYGSETMVYRMEYDGDGRLSRMNWQYGGSDCSNRYGYTGGVLSSIEHLSGGAYSVEEGLEARFGEVANDRLNIDINYLFLSIDDADYGHLNDAYDDDIPGRADRLALLRMLGRGCDCYVVRSEDDDEVGVDSVHGYPDPNVTIPVSYEAFDEEWNPEMVYAFDRQGDVSTITQTCSVVKNLVEYDIVVGDRLVNPELPELGYEYTIENRRVTELDRGTNRYVHTFSYMTR